MEGSWVRSRLKCLVIERASSMRAFAMYIFISSLFSSMYRWRILSSSPSNGMETWRF